MEGHVFVCCPSWMKKPIGNLNKQSIDEIWNSSIAQEIRQSIHDGSFRYCDKKLCPYIVGNLLGTKSQAPADLIEVVKNEQVVLENRPSKIMLTYDQSCNLSCPSCRTEKISHSPGTAPFIESNSYTSLIENEFIHSLGDKPLRLNVTGSGDPFASTAYIQFLEGIDGSKFPNLVIDIQTNGVLLTPLMWERMKKLHKNLGEISVSIDAA